MTEEACKLMGDQSTQLALNVLYCIVSLVLQYVYDIGSLQVDGRSIHSACPQCLVLYCIACVAVRL